MCSVCTGNSGRRAEASVSLCGGGGWGAGWSGGAGDGQVILSIGRGLDGLRWVDIQSVDAVCMLGSLYFWLI